MDSSKNINMLVDADSIFFKVAYKATSESDLRKNYDSFCRSMEQTIKQKLANPFDEEERQEDCDAYSVRRAICRYTQ